MSATYTKLRSGEWGIRSTEPVCAGQTVLVTKRSGERNPETVGRVVWSGDGVVLCSISRATTRRVDDASGSIDWRYLRDGTPGPVRGCSACSRLGRMCPDCRFDEFDC